MNPLGHTGPVTRLLLIYICVQQRMLFSTTFTIWMEGYIVLTEVRTVSVYVVGVFDCSTR